MRLFWAVSFIALPFVSVLAADTGPSFSCAHVTSQVNKLICGSSALSALDRDLALVFGNMQGQPIDQQQLKADQKAWLAALLRDCQDEACIKGRYETRIAALREQSLRAASPAAYEETRPFPTPAPLLAQARALVGTACSYQPGVAGPVIPGFPKAARFQPVILAGGTTVVREKDGARFAFLVFSPPGANGCQIRDVVALPASAVGDRFLQCSATDPAVTGFGVRNAQTHGLDGFWSVDANTHKIERVAMSVLGIEKSVKCRQPETGE
jgi:uncharacterized protein YecT (DUF1311 family)